MKSNVSELEMAKLGRIQELIKKFSRQQQKSRTTNLEHCLAELQAMLLSRSLNEFASTFELLFKSLALAPNSELPTQRSETPLCAQSPLSFGAGTFGGSRIFKCQTPKPSVQSPRVPGSTSTRVNTVSSNEKVELDQEQEDLLKQVLRQTANLNVQVQIKRYDPRIKLYRTQGTDTNQDALEAMRYYSAQETERRVEGLREENEASLVELGKVLKAREGVAVRGYSGVCDKLGALVRAIERKQVEFENFFMYHSINDDTSSGEFEGYFGYVQECFKSVQAESYKIMLRMFRDFLRKRSYLQNQRVVGAEEGEQKKKKEKVRRMQSSEKNDAKEHRMRMTLSEKQVELDIKHQELSVMNDQLRDLKELNKNSDIEIDYLKAFQAKLEQDKTRLMLEIRRLERAPAAPKPPTSDQAVQVALITLNEHLSLKQHQAFLMGELQNKDAKILKLQEQLQLMLHEALHKPSNPSDAASPKLNIQEAKTTFAKPKHYANSPLNAKQHSDTHSPTKKKGQFFASQNKINFKKVESEFVDDTSSLHFKQVHSQRDLKPSIFNRQQTNASLNPNQNYLDVSLERQSEVVDFQYMKDSVFNLHSDRQKSTKQKKRTLTHKQDRLNTQEKSVRVKEEKKMIASFDQEVQAQAQVQSQSSFQSDNQTRYQQHIVEEECNLQNEKIQGSQKRKESQKGKESQQVEIKVNDQKVGTYKVEQRYEDTGTQTDDYLLEGKLEEYGKRKQAGEREVGRRQEEIAMLGASSPKGISRKEKTEEAVKQQEQEEGGKRAESKKKSYNVSRSEQVQQMQQQLQQEKAMQEEILTMREEREEEDYEKEVEHYVKENNGQPLLVLKEHQQAGGVLYEALMRKQGRGAAEVRGQVSRYFKQKGAQVSEKQFKEFYRQLVQFHKPCGEVCIHLQRFFMKIGFTASKFASRRVLRPFKSQVQPF